MSQEQEFLINQIQFNIDNINQYLNNIKHILIKMNIQLDSQEINKFLAQSLNNSLFDNKFNKDTAFNFIIEQDNNTVNIESIKIQIREFNKEQKYEYYVNIEDVQYLVFYKQIKYVREIINEIIQYLNFYVNPVYIYTFIIQSFYDEPRIVTNYIYFIKKIRENLNNDKINKFLEDSKISKLNKILENIYTFDEEFSKLNILNFNNRIKFIKEGIIISTLSYPNNYNCQENKLGNNSIKVKHLDKYSQDENDNYNKDIENLEKEFYTLKCEILFKLRPIKLDEQFNNKINDVLLNDSIITLDLWLGFILFLYKKFNFKHDEFNKIINDMIKANNLDENYNLKLDYFEDLTIAKYEYTNQDGCNISYFKKYLKYKTKYLNLLRKKN